MIKWKQSITMAKSKKFKAVEKDAKDAPVKNLEWEGEEIQAQSKTKLESDPGTGEAIVLRFFDFGANVESFKKQKPTAQDLFNSHIRGMESTLWRDGLRPHEQIQPRLMFSKDKSHYRFIVACTPTMLTDTPQTLSQLLTPSSTK